MIHKFVLGRCIQCNLSVDDLESVGWDCHGHAGIGSRRTPPDVPASGNTIPRVAELPKEKLHATSSTSTPLKPGIVNVVERVEVERPDVPGITPAQTTDIFAILSFATGMLGFWMFPIVFVPLCYICSIVSYYRLRENPGLKGKGLRLSGAILGAVSMLYLFYQLELIG